MLVVCATYAAIWHWLILAFMQLYSIFNLRFFWRILFCYINKTYGIETPDRNGEWYQHLLILFAIYYESNTKGARFRIMLICFTFEKNMRVLYCIHPL